MANESNYICHLNFHFNLDELKNDLSKHKLSYYSLRDRDTWSDEYKAKWLDKEVNIRHRKTTGFIEDENTELSRIVNYFKEKLHSEIKPVVTVQRKNTELPYHKDSDVMPASINFLLDDGYAPITFKDYGDIKYKTALVNISQYHKVKPQDKERQLLKLCIYNKTFEECKELLSEYIQSNR